MVENIWEIDNQRLLFNHNIVLYDAKSLKECTSRAIGAFISLFSAEEASENFYSLGKVSSVSRIMCCYRNNPFFCQRLLVIIFLQSSQKLYAF